MQQVKTMKSWSSGALHMVGCSVQLRCADGRSCRDSRLGCCCCCCCCRFLLTVPLWPVSWWKGAGTKGRDTPTNSTTQPPTHPQPNLGPSDKSPPGPGMSIMPCGRVWPLLCASDFSLTAGYHHCLLSLHLGHNGGEGAHQRKVEWKTTTVEFWVVYASIHMTTPKWKKVFLQLKKKIRRIKMYLHFEAMLCGLISINQLGHANGTLTNIPGRKHHWLR